MFQIALCIIVSFGYGSSYYFLWKLHKPVYKPLMRLRNNKSSIVNSPPGPNIRFITFLSNIWNFGIRNEEANEIEDD